MSLVKEIHLKVEASTDELLARIEREAVGEYLGGFTLGQFAGLVGKYKLRYPQNPFITEDQVKSICLEYDLKLGAMLAFTGEIPERNKQEIYNFTPPKEMAFNTPYFKDKLDIGAILHELRRTFRGSVEMYHNYDEVKLELEGAIEASFSSKLLLPLTKDMAIHLDHQQITRVRYIEPEPQSGYVGCGMMPPVARSAFQYEHHGGLNIVLQDNNYNMVSISIPHQMASITQSMSRGNDFGFATRPRFNRVQMNIEASIDILEVLRTADHALRRASYTPSMKVIAPGEMFNTTALKELDGYRYALDELAITKPAVFVDDPIVLHPVKGGYLVVTKWGGEADLIESNSN